MFNIQEVIVHICLSSHIQRIKYYALNNTLQVKTILTKVYLQLNNYFSL